MTELMQRQKEWIEDNPLRQYRKANKIALMQASSLLGVGVYAIQTWEIGAEMPNEDNMAKLCRMLGEDFPERWAEWIKKQPRV